MLLSMTGFGKASAESKHRRFTAEIKSLNSKQLDFIARVPSLCRELEPELRNLIAAKLERGKVDMIITMESLDGASDVHLNIDRIAEYKRQIESMTTQLGIPAPADWVATLMRLPDIMSTDTFDGLSDDDREAVISAVGQAADALTAYRHAEGIKLESFFTQRINHISDLLGEVPHYEADRIAKIRTRIEDSLKAIPTADYDRGRFEQEMIFYIEKLDINEEKQRLRQHLDYFTETMALPKAGQGKKLGFIAQEMGREINTLGSKSNQAEMQIIVVKMKDELEQIKEQVLNAL